MGKNWWVLKIEQVQFLLIETPIRQRNSKETKYFKLDWVTKGKLNCNQNLSSGRVVRGKLSGTICLAWRTIRERMLEGGLKSYPRR